MTREEIMELDMEGIEARKAEMRTLIEAAADSAALDEIEAEKAVIEERVAIIKAEVEERKADMAKVLEGDGEEIAIPMEERKMDNMEIRNSKEYVEAFGRYLKTGKDEECRALLSVNASGYVPVPEFVETAVRTAWDKTGLMELVRKTYLRGNVKVGFELSADGAVIHTEGAAAPSEESLTLGIVEMIPKSIKKWITISDESADLNPEIIEYIYKELTYRIAKKAEDELVKLITTTNGTTASTTAVSVAEIAGGSSDLLSIVAQGVSHLSDEAANPVIVMNKLTFAQFKAAQNSAEYAVDPFVGLPVYFNNTLATIGATSGTWLIVGDFGNGAQANFPNGDEINIKYDDLSLAEKDLIKLVGREYIGLGLVADKSFTRVIVST